MPPWAAESPGKATIAPQIRAATVSARSRFESSRRIYQHLLEDWGP